MYCLLWLGGVKNFRPTPVLELDSEERVSEHQQVRSALFDFGEKRTKEDLSKLVNLRKKS